MVLGTIIRAYARHSVYAHLLMEGYIMDFVVALLIFAGGYAIRLACEIIGGNGDERI